MVKKRKIMLFDHWDKSESYKLLMNRLDRELFSVSCFHLGSLRESQINYIDKGHNYYYKDIKYYQTNNILKIFQRERPDLVFILNENYMLDIVIINCARFYNIKVVFLMHGLLPVGETVNYVVKTAHKGLIKKRYKLLKKYIFIIFPNYLYSSFKSNPRLLFSSYFYLSIMEYLLFPSRSIYKSMYRPRDFKSDYAFVYGEAFKKMKIDEGYSAKQIKVVGNPFLDDAVKTINKYYNNNMFVEAIKTKLGFKPNDEIVTYFEGAYVEAGYSGWTEASRIKYLNEIAHACANSGKKLIIKMHPKADPSSIIEYFKNKKNVIVLTQYDIAILSIISVGIISEYSTTLFIPIWANKPIYVPCFGIAEGVPNLFIEEKVAIACKSIEELIEYLSSNICPINIRLNKIFLRKYAGNNNNSVELISKYIMEITHFE